LTLRPTTFIGHPTQTKLVDTYPNVGVTTISSHPRSCITSSSRLTHSLDTNEWVTLESNNTTTSWSSNKKIFSTRLPYWVVSLLVKAYTRPTALGRYPSGFFVGAPPVDFFLAYHRAKCPVCSYM